MKLVVKDMDIATGGILVAVLNEEDARRLDLFPEDRIKIKFRKRETTAIIDIAQTEKAVPKGHIGLFEEVLKKLNVKDGDIVDIDLRPKPSGVFAIRKKLDGIPLKRKEIFEIIKELVEDKLSQVELTYFIGACYTKGMTLDETVNLTKAIVHYGGKLKIDRYPILDKHCTGGVPGNRTSMLIVPIIAAAGYTIPKTSSRSITSPAGTADTMEVLAPVALTLEQMKKVVLKTNGCIVWGGAMELASADDKLIRLRDPLALDPEGMLLASILAKKAAVGATHVLIDIPLGKETKIKTKTKALHLEKKFKLVGKHLGMNIRVMLSDGKEPIGNGIGPVLEAKTVLWTLMRDPRRPRDLERKAVRMATLLLEMVGVKNARRKVIEILKSGEAYRKMKEIIEAQGGDPNIKPEDLVPGQFKYTYRAQRTGYIANIDCISVRKMVRAAGAPKDKDAGLFLYKHEGESVLEGEPIFTLYAHSKEKLRFGLSMFKRLGGIEVR